MFILGFSIPVLVLYFKYKKVQTSGKRTAIIILNILLSVFSFFSLIDLLITIIGGSLLNSDYIRQIYESSRGSSYNYSYVNPSDVITTTSSILATVMWALMIINFFILVFGVIVNILGYTAIANKTWTANAIADAQNKRMNAMNYTYYNQSAPQNSYGQAQNPYGQAQNPYGQTQNPYGQAQNPYGQAQNPYGQPPQNPYGQTFAQNNNQPVQQSDGSWLCVCGKRNASGQKYCSFCGAANPDSTNQV
jgi:hypothetical protein